MTKKWYNYFVSVDEAGNPVAGAQAGGQPGAAAAPMNPAQTVAEIASSVSAEPKFTAPISNASSFEEI